MQTRFFYKLNKSENVNLNNKWNFDLVIEQDISDKKSIAFSGCRFSSKLSYRSYQKQVC